MIKPLEDVVVLDFTQFLSGPSASLRLADLGAEVIKIEQPEQGDLCRRLYVSNCDILGESSLFQAINRNKKSVTLNLKNAEDKKIIEALITRADVVINNFRPTVMKKLGLDYAKVQVLNPRVIYGEITGYGCDGPWSYKPGQDLLLQALSGLTWLSGNDSDGPVPMGVAVADILAGAQLVQGILAALINQDSNNSSTLVQVSMLEAILDFQFEPLTLYYQDQEQPRRNKINGAHALVGGAYGLYKTLDGYICISMGGIPQLGQILGCEPLLAFTDASQWFAQRDDIKLLLKTHLVNQTTQYWLSLLEPADIWCSDVLNWEDLLAHDGFKALDMLQTVSMSDGSQYETTRCPIRIDGEFLLAEQGAPKLGEHNAIYKSNR